MLLIGARSGCSMRYLDFFLSYMVRFLLGVLTAGGVEIQISSLSIEHFSNSKVPHLEIMSMNFRRFEFYISPDFLDIYPKLKEWVQKIAFYPLDGGGKQSWRHHCDSGDKVSKQILIETDQWHNSLIQRQHWTRSTTKFKSQHHEPTIWNRAYL